MTYDARSRCPTYLVVASAKDPVLQGVKARLSDFMRVVAADARFMPLAKDPLFFHTMISHESLTQAKPIIAALRGRLYDQLDAIDDYVQKKLGKDIKDILEKATIELHNVSQNLDSFIAGAEMAEMIADWQIRGHERFKTSFHPKNIGGAFIKTEDSLQYLRSSIQQQRRWLLSNKARKDTAMSLVRVPAQFNPIK